jgi:hypothetical protein
MKLDEHQAVLNNIQFVMYAFYWSRGPPSFFKPKGLRNKKREEWETFICSINFLCILPSCLPKPDDGKAKKKKKDNWKTEEKVIVTRKKKKKESLDHLDDCMFKKTLLNKNCLTSN